MYTDRYTTTYRNVNACTLMTRHIQTDVYTHGHRYLDICT